MLVPFSKKSPRKMKTCAWTGIENNELTNPTCYLFSCILALRELFISMDQCYQKGRTCGSDLNVSKPTTFFCLQKFFGTQLTSCFSSQGFLIGKVVLANHCWGWSWFNCLKDWCSESVHCVKTFFFKWHFLRQQMTTTKLETSYISVRWWYTSYQT